MDYDYTRRSYLLPEGCKDLFDVIATRVTVSDRRLTIKAILPEAHKDEVEITVVERTVRIRRKPCKENAAFESDTEVPPEYDLSKASPSYCNGASRVCIPMYGETRTDLTQQA